jgi:integrase
MANLTKKFLNEITLPIDGQYDTYHDDKIKGLSLRVSSKGKMSFFSRSRVEGEPVIVNYGAYPNITIDQARAKAHESLNLISLGINPNKQSAEDEVRQITLNQVLDDYITSRGTNLKANTSKNYRSTFNGYLKDWGKKEMLSISRDMVEKRHRKITKQSPTRANSVMRLLRALFNYGMGEYEDANGEPIIFHNPTQRLSHIKAWNREKRKKTIIKSYDLKVWWSAVHELPTHELNAKKPNHSETARDYFIFVLLTGLRRREASTLKWTDIDFRDNTLNIEDTKNHESHSLPLTDYLVDLLRQRQANTDSLFVFEGNDPTKPMNDPKKQVAKVRVISNVYFNIHDLRRTFITIAESLDVPQYALKQLINHKDARDVTAGYIIMGVERLRQPMNNITNFILEQVK